MTNILVTGGAGYVGSHACKLLSQAGYTPVSFDNLSTGWAQAVKFGPFIKGDLLDPTALDTAMAAYRPAAVMHFAALSNVGQATHDPALYWRNNVLGTLNLILAMTRADCKTIVFSSTCAIYGNQNGVPLNESTIQDPLNAYGASKQAVENMLRDFRISHGLQSVIFRYFNVAGADPDGEIGECHRPETHLIPRVLQGLSQTNPTIQIFGTDYPTPDGTCLRDYVHVTDIAKAHMQGLDWMRNHDQSATFNLGSGRGFSVAEVISHCQRITAIPANVEIAPRRTGDAAALVADTTYAAHELNWHPHQSDLNTMITDAWNWHKTGGYTH
jgi:UDP-glucose 4-epimerase